jgi:3-oxoacyl-[acyl-carrier protein] reductase
MADKTILITGATQGIGKSISNELLKHGTKLILTGNNKDKINKLISNNQNPRIEWIQANFSTEKNIFNFIERIKNKKIDICINNAGINIIKPIERYSKKDYDSILNTNLKAPTYIIKEILPYMKKNKFGRIVNILSIWSIISKVNRSLYSMTKAGLSGYTRTAALEGAEFNIIVNSVSPGFTLTELTKKSLTKTEINTLSKEIPLKRFANTNEISKVVDFLASDQNTYITGQNIIIDGGYSII